MTAEYEAYLDIEADSANEALEKSDKLDFPFNQSTIRKGSRHSNLMYKLPIPTMIRAHGKTYVMVEQDDPNAQLVPVKFVNKPIKLEFSKDELENFLDDDFINE